MVNHVLQLIDNASKSPATGDAATVQPGRGSPGCSVQLSDNVTALVGLVAAHLGVDPSEAIGRAISFYGEHGLGIAALASGDLPTVPAFERANFSRFDSASRAIAAARAGGGEDHSGGGE